MKLVKLTYSLLRVFFYEIIIIIINCRILILIFSGMSDIFVNSQLAVVDINSTSFLEESEELNELSQVL